MGEASAAGRRRSGTGTWLGAILLLGLSLRLGYLLHAVSLPGYAWHDPDSYASKAVELANGSSGSGWEWSFDAVRHSVSGRDYLLPPLYPAFLSLFARFPGYPLSAQVGQIVLGTLAIGLVFLLGRQVHSERAGLIAALAYALWLPNVIAVWSTMQEALYVPLVLLAFVLLLRGLSGDEGLRALLPAGLVFGLAALTRSMPVYFLPVAAVLVWNRRRVAGLLLGFVAVTVPYSLALSLHVGRATFIENHGGIRIVERYGGAEGEEPPGTLTAGTTLLRALARDPSGVSADWSRTARSLFHVNGGRLLQIYLGAATKAEAAARKLAVHVFGDGLLIAVMLLAPFGLALCRERRFGALLAAWIVLNVGLTVVSGFGGPRLRAPFEPHGIVLAAVPVAGGYRRASRFGVGAAASGTLVLGTVLLPQLPESLKARADYGVHWPLRAVPKRSVMHGEAGLNVLAVDGAVELALRPRNPAGRTLVEVSAGGIPAEVAVVDEGEQEHRFRIEWPRLELVHVELAVTDLETGEPVRALVVVPQY